jgi:hypothetical protein
MLSDVCPERTGRYSETLCWPKNYVCGHGIAGEFLCSNYICNHLGHHWCHRLQKEWRVRCAMGSPIHAARARKRKAQLEIYDGASKGETIRCEYELYQ